jgi:hypothetical protein
MRKVKTLLVVGLAAASLSIPAAPAHASCNTDIGDVCKAVDVVCTVVPAAEKLISYCRA